MSVTTAFDNVVHFGRETVKKTFEFIGEDEVPLLNYFNRQKKVLLTEQGRRMPIRTTRPGGHTSFGRADVNFRAPVSFEGESMRVYPVWYALPFKIDGATLRALKRGDENQFIKYKDYMQMLTKSAKKRLNIYCHDDATGILAVLDTAFASTGNTLSLHTLASSAAGAGGTKGGVRLEQNHVYSIIDASSETLNMNFSVTTPSRTDPTVAAVTGAIASGAAGDFVVDRGPTATSSAYKKAPQGLRGLINTTGLLQGVSRSTYPDLKSQRINGNDMPVTPLNFNNARALVNIAANDMNEARGRVIVMTPGQDAILRAQQYGYRQYKANETVRGVAQKYVDADGDTYLFDADGAEDRIYMFDGGSIYFGEEKPFGMYNEDSQEIRMLHGTNTSGSDAYFGAIGWGGNLIKEGLPRCDAYIDRLSQSGVMQQTSL